MSNIENNDSAFVRNDELYNKRIKSEPAPERKQDVDLDKTLYDNIIGAAEHSALDINAFNSLSQTANNRNELYNMIDAMCEDGIISAVVETYAEDATERNDAGNIMWVESPDDEVAKCVEYYLDTLNVNKNIYKWVYSLCKYGDVYLRLYRQSEFEDELFSKKKPLNEDLKIISFKKSDSYAHYMEMVSNPAQMFELTKFGKTVGYVKAPVDSGTVKKDDITQYMNFVYNFKQQDLELYPATEFVHACLEDSVSRDEETVNIFLSTEDYEANTNAKTYKVRKGNSLLTDVFKIWRELSLLQASVLLNRLTKSSIVRMINIEVGDMPKENVTKVLMDVKRLIEQKTALNKNNGMQEYTNPGPIENNVYVPTHNGIGSITTSQIGGDVDVKSLADLDYYQNLLFGSLRTPKQYFCLRGDTPILLLNGETRTLKYLYENKDNYVGMGILSCDEKGVITPTTIKSIMLTKHDTNFIRIHLDNGKYVDVTPEHRMMLRDGSFIEAQELKENDSLMPYYDKIVDGRRHILDNFSGKWKLQYRLVAENLYSKEELYNKQVHHINHIKINDDPSNLIPLTGTEHINEHIKEMHNANKLANQKRRDNGIQHGNKGKFSVTNGVINMWLNAGENIPEGYYLGQTCNYSEEGLKKISQAISKANKGKPSSLKGETKYTSNIVKRAVENGTKTRNEREALGLYKEMHKKHSQWCKENQCWKKIHEGHMKTIPENRVNKPHYVRCAKCGNVQEIMCNDDWYNEYLNLDRLWYCSSECYKFDGRGKLARSYKLYVDSGYDLEVYAYNRTHNELHRSDFYFLPETLNEKLSIISNYSPLCNHKVTKIEWLDVSEDAYDIEVTSDNHTFSLPCGIFVHNCQTDDSTGFNGGTSLSIISSRYAKMIKRIQNTIIQAVTDAVNLMLIDKGLDSYVNEFTLHMQIPTTQEEIDRRESQSNKVQLVSDIMNMLSDIEDTTARVKILKSLLSTVVDDNEIMTIVQEYIDKLESEQGDEIVETSVDEKETERPMSSRGSRDLNRDFARMSEPEIDSEGSEEEESETILPTPDELGVDMSDTEQTEQ